MISRQASTLALLLGATVAGAGLMFALRHSRETLSTLNREKHSLAEDVRTLTAERSRLQSEMASRDQHEVSRRTADPAMILELRATLARLVAAREDNPVTSFPGQSYPRSSKGDIFPELLADPEYLRHCMAYQRASIDQRYADFFATTSAHPEAVEKLRHALVQRSIADLEREELIARHGVPPSERGELSHFLAEKSDAEMREILGETAHAEFQRHEKTLPQRNAVAAFAERLSYAEQPLANAQSAQLVALMTEATEPHGTRRFPARKFTDEVIARAKSVLSPPQWEELQRFQQERDTAERR